MWDEHPMRGKRSQTIPGSDVVARLNRHHSVSSGLSGLVLFLSLLAATLFPNTWVAGATGFSPLLRPQDTKTAVAEDTQAISSASHSSAIETLGDTWEIIIDELDTGSLTLPSHLSAVGDAVSLSAARINGDGTTTPVETLPAALTLTLSYAEADLGGAGIPDERLLGVYYGSDGSWIQLDCPSDSCQCSLSQDEFLVSVTQTGVYAIAGPLLDTESLLVVPSSIALWTGESAQFDASIKDISGSEIADPPVTWQAEASAGTIDDQGVFTATGAPGYYPHAVTATLGDAVADANVTILSQHTHFPLVLAHWSPTRTPNDPYYFLQWNMRHIGAPAAWWITIGEPSATVAILDTGVDMDHPDLIDNLVPGWDFVNADALPDDDHGHGTHVAGILGARGNNRLGVAGLAWQSALMPLKILDENGIGYADAAYKAVVWAVDNGARVLNMSFGACGQSPPLLEAAVSYALAKGVVVVAAVGNVDGSTGCPAGSQVYPAAYPGVLGVGATDSSDNVASYSNKVTFLDVAAPGTGIFSTSHDGGYRYMDGTSMATPHVSGVAALIRSAYPNLTHEQVIDAITGSAIDLGVPGWDPSYGYGLVNAGQALTTAAAMGAADTKTTPHEFGSTEDSHSPHEAIPGTYRPGTLVIQMAQGCDPQVLVSFMSSNGLDPKLQPSLVAGLYRISVPAGQEIDFMHAFERQPGVEAAYLDYLLFAM